MNNQTLQSCLQYLKNKFKIEEFDADFFYDIRDINTPGIIITVGKTVFMEEKYLLINNRQEVLFDPDPESGALLSNVGYYLIKEFQNEKAS